tara:strand:- start:13410 stop:14243 length:834 start_codon:yes stop_codon:yes gene_type:complete
MENKFRKRISYILITKNRADSLDICLSQFKKIKKNNDELIIVDGASHDHTKKVINKYKDLVDIFISEPDSSANEATNKGIMNSNGKYLKQITDDDIWYEDGFEKAIKVMDNNPTVDMIVCGGIRKFKDKETLIYVPPGSDYGSSVDKMFKNGFTKSGMGVLFKKDLIYKIGLFEVDRNFVDMGFILRAIFLGANVKFCRIKMFYHTLTENSITVKDKEKYIAEYKYLLNRYCSEDYKKKYILKNKILYKLLSKVIKSIFSQSNKKGKVSPIWDGGFS